MKAFILLYFTASCYGIKWKVINDFKDIFHEYTQPALRTIASVENIINTSRNETKEFLENVYNNNTLINKLTDIESSKKQCYDKFLKKDNLEWSIQIQVFQLVAPLQRRVIDIRQRLNDINSTIGLYQNLADSRFWSCQVFNNNCMEETNQWLESGVNSLSCLMYANCKSHPMHKRSPCSSDQFRCLNGGCTKKSYFCDGECDCSDCSDEPNECVKNCNEFRCTETFKCIPYVNKCDGNDDCGDGSDEENCPPPTTTTPSAYYHGNCSIETGDFLCSPKKCIKVERVCDGYNDCEDGSDEGELCKDRQCTPECSKKGGICMTGPKGPQCLFECPPGTFETSAGCSHQPEAPPATLAQAIDDTPRLIYRYSARFDYLKTKTMMEISKSMMEFVRCKKEEFTLLSKIIRFPSEFHQLNAPSTNHPIALDLTAKPAPSSTTEGGLNNPLGTEESTTTTDSL